MRAIISGALFLAACSQAPSETNARSQGCALEATRNVSWSREGAPDTVTARAEGPSCTQTIVIWVLRNADGDPLWAYASTYHDMTAGGVGAEGAPEVSAEAVQRFLDSWANVRVNSSSDLPAWPESAASLGDAVQGIAYATAYERDAYEEMRARGLPQLCYAASAESSQCLVIDPLSGTPTVLAAFGA